MTRLAAAHRIWFIADIFIDVESAKTGITRLEFNRMISEFERGDLDIILTTSFSRFGRDAKEGLEAIRKRRATGNRTSANSYLRETVSEYSYGFRSNTRVYNALKWCQTNVNDGYVYVVDMDLEKFFDTVCQSKLIEVLS